MNVKPDLNVIKMRDTLIQHLEEFAAAFCKRTNSDPTEIVMIVRNEADLNGYTMKIWFEKKEETDAEPK